MVSTRTTAAVMSAILVLPFVTFEMVNNRGFHHFPIVLFGVMWVLAWSFFLVATSIARNA